MCSVVGRIVGKLARLLTFSIFIDIFITILLTLLEPVLKCYTFIRMEMSAAKCIPQGFGCPRFLLLYTSFGPKTATTIKINRLIELSDVKASI